MEKKNINIGGVKVGNGQPVFVIAEVSANHRGKIETALSAIDAAAEAGADAVKFQHLTHNKIAAEPLSDFYKSAELPYSWTAELMDRAVKKKIIFLSTPFDHEAIKVLDEAGVPAFKVASYEMTDDILLRDIAQRGKPVIISTGMAFLEEVVHAVNIVKNEGNDQIIVLHCVSLYPPQAKDLNLKVIKTLRQKLNLPIGYSDHSDPSSNAAALGAVSLGACVIERHITDSQIGGSNDDRNSMTVEQFSFMVREIRFLSDSLSGSGKKEPVSDSSRAVDEIKERGTRRSLYVKHDVSSGSVLNKDMLLTLRPNCGVEPKDLGKIIGKKIVRNISARSPITWEDIEI